MFEDREDAGELLAEALSRQNLDVDVVLLTSLDSFTIGEKIAAELGVPLNSMISTELTIPGDNLAFGAVSEQGTIWIDDSIKQKYRVDKRYVSKIKSDRMQEIQSVLKNLGVSNKPDLNSKNVLLVSSGIDSGMKEAASLGAALRLGAEKRVVVTTNVSNIGLERLGLADTIISLKRSSLDFSPNKHRFYNRKNIQEEIKSYFSA